MIFKMNVRSKLKGIVSLLTVVTVCASLFFGCTFTNDLAVYNAVMKTDAEVHSCQSEFNTDVHVAGEGLSKAQKKQLTETINLFDESSIKVRTSTSGNQEKTVRKSKVSIGIDIGGLQYVHNIWEDEDRSTTVPSYKLYMQMPGILRASMPYVAAKKYWYLDAGEPDNGAVSSPSFRSDIHTAGKTLLDNLKTEFKYSRAMFTKLTDATLNGEAVSVYEMKLTDKEMKDLFDYAGTDFIINQNVIAFVQAYLHAYIDATSVSVSEATKAKAEMDKLINSYKKDSKQFGDAVSQILSSIKDINLLGEKGIAVKVMLNDEGIIVKTEGVVDLSVPLFDDKGVQTNGKLNLTFNFSNVIIDINSEIAVDMPVLTADNSFNMKYLPKLVENIPLSVKKITNKTATITGKTEPNIDVRISNWDNKNFIKSLVSDSKGNFSLKLSKKLKPHTIIDVTVENDYTTTSKYYLVRDVIPPAKVKITTKVTTKTGIIKGKAEKYSTVFIKKGKKVLKSKEVYGSGKFSIKIPKQKKNTVLYVYARDGAKNVGKSVKIVVK